MSEKRITPGHRLAGKPPAFDAGIAGSNPAAPTIDQLTSFPILSEEEAEEFKERMRIDHASIYGG